MKSLLAVDSYKMIQSKVVKVLFFLAVLSAGLMVYFSHQFSLGTLDGGNSLVNFFSDMQIFSLLGSIVMGLFFCNDFEDKIIENAISSGHKRWNIVSSKVITLLFLTILFAVPYMLVILIMAGFDLSLSIYLPTPFFSLVELVNSSASIGKIMVMCVSIILVYVAQLSIGLPILFLLKKPVLVMILNYILLGLLGTLLSVEGGVKEIISWTPYGIDFHHLATDLDLVSVAQTLTISLLFVLAMTLISFILFRKAEIK